MNILDIAIAKKLAGGGGGSGTDNYNDLSNLPKINDTPLSGNKSSSALGLQSEINSDSKLASDLVDDTNQDNKFVTSTEKNTWNAKQNAIDADHKINADYVDDSTSTNKFVTASDKETWNAKQNAIDNSHKLSSDLVDDTNHTNKFVTSTEKQTWNAKQNAIDADHKLSSSLVSFTDAEAAALASGIDSSKVGQISTNQTNILYALDKVGTNYVYDYEHGMATPTTMSGVTFTWLDNGKLSIQSNGTNTSDVYYNLEVDVGSRYVGKTMSFVGGVASKCAFYISNSSDAVAISTTSADVTIPSNAVNKLFIAVFANAGAFDITVEPMIRDSNITSNAYSAPALPNYDLTRLEAEDRAALAEQVDEGAKNIIKIFSKFSVPSGLTVTKNADESITVNGSVTRADYIHIGSISAKAGTYRMLPSSVVFSENVVSFLYTHDNYLASSGGRTSHVYQSEWSTDVVLFCPANTTYNNATYYPMICTEADWKISQNYAPFALPNTDLTRLEAEDRAALVEEIDAGSKNKFDLASLNNPTLNNVTVTKADSSIVVTSSGSYARAVYSFDLNAGTYKLRLSASDITNESGSDTAMFVGLYKSSTITSNNELCRIYCTTAGDKYVEFNHAGGTVYIAFYVNGSSTSYTNTYTISQMMICTEADWKISPKFVPYRKNLDQLEATKAPILNGSVDSGSINDVTTNTFAMYTSNVTDLPTADNYYVETSVFDSNSLLQRAYNIAFGTAYVRVKCVGQWSTWNQLTNA